MSSHTSGLIPMLKIFKEPPLFIYQDPERKKPNITIESSHTDIHEFIRLRNEDLQKEEDHVRDIFNALNNSEYLTNQNIDNL